jgi:hypothetical protein
MPKPFWALEAGIMSNIRFLAGVYGLSVSIAISGCGSPENQTEDTGSDQSQGVSETASEGGSQRNADTTSVDAKPNSDGEARETLDGAELAEKHIAANELHLREPPLPYPPWYTKYSQLLKDRWQVTITVVDRAPLTAADLDYNAAMKAEIEKRHGPGAIGKCMDDAQKKPTAPAAP